MTPGYVYVLTNEAMPGLVKIGRTTRNVDLRAAELWQTGVPTRFKVYARERTYDCVDLERLMHQEFADRRAHASREFFRLDPEVAMERLQFWANLQAKLFISQHFDGVTAVEYEHAVDPEAIKRMAESFHGGEFDVIAAMAELTAEELAPAMQRVRDKRSAEMAQLMRDLGIDGGDSE